MAKFDSFVNIFPQFIIKLVWSDWSKLMTNMGTFLKFWQVFVKSDIFEPPRGTFYIVFFLTKYAKDLYIFTILQKASDSTISSIVFMCRITC